MHTNPYTMLVRFLSRLKFPKKHGQDLPQNYLSKCGMPEATVYGLRFFSKAPRLRVTTLEGETALEGMQKLIRLFLLSTCVSGTSRCLQEAGG